MKSEMKRSGEGRQARVAAAILSCLLAGAAVGCNNGGGETSTDAENGASAASDARVVLEEKAERLKKIGRGIGVYANVYGALPPVFSADPTGKPLHSWRVLILPYIDELALYEQIRLDEPWDSEHNSQFHSQTPAIFAASNDATKTAFSVVVGEKTAYAVGKKHELMKTADGTSYTLGVVERKTPVCWMDPMAELTLETLPDEFARDADGNGIALALDGAPRLVPASVDAEGLKGLATASGGEAPIELELIKKSDDAAK